MLVYSKIVVGLALFYLAERAFTPAKSANDGRKDCLLRAGAVARYLAFKTVIVPLLCLFQYYHAPYWRLTQPWDMIDVIIAANSASGSLLRLWAMHELGRQFPFEVGVLQDHQLVSTGLYKFSRHPAYEGAWSSINCLILFLGFNGHWWSPLALLLQILTFVGLGLRIRDEEAALHKHFGKAWEEHCSKTCTVLFFLFSRSPFTDVGLEQPTCPAEEDEEAQRTTQSA